MEQSTMSATEMRRHNGRFMIKFGQREYPRYPPRSKYAGCAFIPMGPHRDTLGHSGTLLARICATALIPTISILYDPQAIKYIHILRDRLAVLTLSWFTSPKSTSRVMQEDRSPVSSLGSSDTSLRESEVRRYNMSLLCSTRFLR
eukprot:scaffold35847_cov105-Skeletonema_dohrnii-CCMP3373.AAC.5